MHCHTRESSKCASIDASDLVDFYKSAGYDGIVITDHFFNGNTIVPRDLSWEERVVLFLKGFENACERGRKIGVDVFLGWEFSLNGTDFLTYGLNREWLLAHENCDKLSINEYCDTVHHDGGFIVQAHPFREAGYIEMIRLLPRKVDAVETINVSRTDFENRLADEYANNYSLIKLAGTDNHVGFRERIAAVEIDSKAENINDIMRSVMRNKHRNLIYNVQKCENNIILL